MAEEDSTGGSGGSAAPDAFPSEEYECKICFNYFDLDRHIPKLLSCSHTFCQECLETLHFREGRGWRIGCPVCRHRSPVPEYQIHNLSNNTALTEAFPPQEHQHVSSSNTEEQTVSPPTSSQETNDSWKSFKDVAFTTGLGCAIFSLLSMVVLLFLGLIFVHNFNHVSSPVGPVCLSVASVLALFSLILTWLMCMLKYRPDTEASNFIYPPYHIM
ncbi:RING finger protein 228-like [Embiotoca jacksoni]|uniref:RING finger protein 228-like n=1 Tax=Embiotoca jacksoni TaxID=100190 RepID=UPI003703F732